MPRYQEQFPVGSRVREKERPFLEQFQRDWNYHHPISADQLEAAGKMDTVESIGFYRGGDVLYQLSEISGTWHEVCLEFPMQSMRISIVETSPPLHSSYDYRRTLPM